MSSEPTKSSWASKKAKEVLYRPLGNSLDPNWWNETQCLIEAAILAAEVRGAEEEREECAKLVESFPNEPIWLPNRKRTRYMTKEKQQRIAKAIRQRTGRNGK